MQPNVTGTKPIRCAIYTRKSTDEGLEQEFNSLDAQRESAEAYVLSQRHERWTSLLQHYDDGGFSGATIERPALKRLLADAEAGKLDCVVVYKVDRLSRSLLDFARIMEIFDKRGVSFVSVTQQLNTTSSMGRLTLNVLLSFAQFEREIISERTRDKMSAARRKGKWTGGCPPLGYDTDPATRKLLVNRSEAEQVRQIFSLFVQTKSLLKTLHEIERRGWKTKSWVTQKSKNRAGSDFDRPTLVRLLTTVLYVGEVKHNGKIYTGEQEAIVDRTLWTKANELLEKQRRGANKEKFESQQALFQGLLQCGVCGKAMVHGYAMKADRHYRYYQCATARKKGTKACPGQVISAKRIEDAVVGKLYELAGTSKSVELQKILPRDTVPWESLDGATHRRIIQTLATTLVYDHRSRKASFRLQSSDEDTEVLVRKHPFERHSMESSGPNGTGPAPRIARLVALAVHFDQLLNHGTVRDYTELARLHQVSPARISQIMKLRNLAPSIQETLLFWNQDEASAAEADLRSLSEKPLWNEQAKKFEQLQGGSLR